MGKGILAIYDSDMAYAERLMDYLNRKKDFLLEAQVFTNEAAMEKALEEKTIEIALISESLSIEKMNRTNIRKFLILSEGGFISEGEKQKTIYKYQSAENLIREIVSACLWEEERVPIAAVKQRAGKSSVISLFSPCGGCGKTELSFALAGFLSRERSVLLVNWEVFPAEYGDSRGDEGGFSELMYYRKQGKGNMTFKLKAMVRTVKQVAYLPPADHFKDLYELEKEDVDAFLEMLLTYGGYDAIIFDVGFLSEAVIHLLEKSDKVLMPLWDGKEAKEKAERFHKYLKIEQKEELYEKCNSIPMNVELLGSGTTKIVQRLVEEWKKNGF